VPIPPFAFFIAFARFIFGALAPFALGVFAALPDPLRLEGFPVGVERSTAV
jgi:hypothetical protein